MAIFTRRRKTTTRPSPAPLMESLESRQLFSATISATVAGPLPESAISGFRVHSHIGVNIANSGPDRAHGKVLITLFASLDNTLDAADAQITFRARGINVAAGRNQTYFIPVLSYPQNLNNNYFILAKVEGTTVNTAIAASNTTINIVPPTIDLGANITFVPQHGHVGRRIIANIDVSNSGNTRARGSLPVAFSLSSSADGSNPVGIGTLSRVINLLPGHHRVLHFPVLIPYGVSTGNQYVVADVDPTNRFFDPNVVNNGAVSTTPVSVS